MTLNRGRRRTVLNIEAEATQRGCAASKPRCGVHGFRALGVARRSERRAPRGKGAAFGLAWRGTIASRNRVAAPGFDVPLSVKLRAPDGARGGCGRFVRLHVR